jgi:hypothetical protein
MRFKRKGKRGRKLIGWGRYGRECGRAVSAACGPESAELADPDARGNTHHVSRYSSAQRLQRSLVYRKMTSPSALHLNAI